MFFLTLTYDHTDLSLGEAWKRCTLDIIKYEKQLRLRKDIKFSSIRCISAHTKGYPHIHILIIFKDQFYKVYKHICKKGKDKGKITWRLKSYETKKLLFGGINSDKTKTPGYLWQNGFVDVEGCINPQGSLNYILGYMSGEKGNNLMDSRSLALNWLFRKRSFGMSSFESIQECLTHIAKIYKSPNLSSDNEKLTENREIHFVGIVRIDFFDRPPPFFMDISEYPLLINEIMVSINSLQQHTLYREKLRDTSNPQSIFIPGYGDKNAT